MELPPDDLIVFDEAHRSRGRTREHLISFYPDAMLLGMPATPFRGDGRGLGNLFDTMVETPQVAELATPRPAGRTQFQYFKPCFSACPVCPISGNPLSRMLFSSDAVSAFSHRSSVHRQRST